MKVSATVACLAFAALATPVAAQNLTVTGPTGQVVTLTAADIAAMPHVKVTLDAHGEKHEYAGPLLIDVVARAGAPTGKDIHGPALADVIVATASDGYAVAYGLGEADPGTRPNPVILADQADGGPLSAKDAPFKVVVDGDLRPARAARMVTALKVVSLAGK